MRLSSSALAASMTLAALTAPVGAARATVVQALDLEQKVAAAPVIVHGVVARVASDWSVPEVRIRTMITVEVKTSLKGSIEPGTRLLVERGGGTVDGVTQTAPGLSPYFEGEEVVLFLEPLGPHFVAIGIGIGKYDVRLEGGERMVHHEPHVYGLRFTEGASVLEPIAPTTPEPLDAFFKRVRTLVTRPKPKGPKTKGPKTTARQPSQSPRIRPPLPLPSNR